MSWENILNLLRGMRSGHKTTRAGKKTQRARFLPALELLERRELLSAMITGPGDQNGTEGDPISGVYITTSGFTDTISYSASNLPAGLAVDSSSGEISGTLSYGDASTSGGNYSVDVGATGSAEGLVTSSFNFTVAAAASTTTTLSLSPTLLLHGQSITFTAAVTSGSGTPSGTVDFFLDGTDEGSSTLASGSTTFSLSGVSMGSHVFHAVYNGAASFYTSDSVDLTQTVYAASSTALSVDVNPVAYGQTVNFTTTVSSADGAVTSTPTGTTDFVADGTLDEGSATLSGGIGTLGTSSLAVGTHTITSTYSGDGTYAASSSSSLSLNVVAAPQAYTDSYLVGQDNTLNVTTAGGLLSNDSDPASYTLSVASHTNPAHGTLSLSSDGSFTYAPTGGYSGSDSFTYDDSNGYVTGNTVAVAITVTPAPQANDHSYALGENTTLTVIAASGLLNGDSDPSGYPLSVGSHSSPSHGTLTLSSDGSFTYVPTSGFTGDDSFTYQATDGYGTSNTGTVTLTVAAPLAGDDSYEAEEDQTLTVSPAGVLANDHGASGATLAVAWYTSPSNGTLTLSTDGSFSYVPDSSFTGNDSFTYNATDSYATSNTATVTITVLAPQANDDSYSVGESQARTVAAGAGVLANDTVAPGATLTVASSTSPSHGSLSLGSDGSFTYTPTAGYVGSDSFTYVATDGSNTTNTGTVTLSVFAPGTLTGDYLANDTAQGTTVAFGDAAVSPQTGLATVNVGLGGDAPDLELVYTPDVTVKPIIQTTFASDSSLSVPTQLSVTLVWNGTSGSPVTFSTTGHAVGDTYVLDMQVPSAVTSSGVYPAEIIVTASYAGGIEATATTSGSAAVVVSGYGGGASPFGLGWSLLPAGDQLVSVSGGVLWVDGQGGVQYFSGPDGSGKYMRPDDDLGLLVLNTDGSYTYTAHDGSQVNFDSSGRVTSIVDTHGLAQAFTYGTHGLTSITEINGVVETLSYDTNGYVQTITEPGGEVVTLAHDSGGNLTGLAFPDSGLRTFTYDTGHRLTTEAQGPALTTYTYDSSSGVLTGINRGLGDTLTVTAAATQGLATSPAKNASAAVGVLTDALGRVTTFTMDDQGRDLRLQTADGSSQEWTYNSSGQVTTATDPLGRTTTYSYDATSADLSQVTFPDGTTQQFIYSYNGTDPLPYQIVIVDQLSERTTYTYDPTTGDLLTTTDALNGVTTYTWSSGLEQTVTNALGNTTTLLYDSYRHLQTVIDPAGDRTTYQYDTAGKLTALTDALNHTTSYLYDAMGRQTGVVNALGGHTTLTYDTRGDLTSITDANANTTTFQYDALGRETVQIDPLGDRTTLAYDAVGNLTSVTDANNHTTQFQYDAVNRPTVKIDPLGNRTTTAYDAASEVTAVTDALNHTTSYQYDTLGRETLQIDPLGNRTSMTYDADGNLTSVTDALNHTTSYQYDAVNRPTVTIDPLGNRTTAAYDAVGDVITLTDALNHTTTYQYDAVGRQTVTIDPLGNRTTFAYDAVGDVTSVTDALNHTTSYQYDALGRETVAIDPLGNRTTMAYDGVGNLTAVTDPLNHTTTYQYDALGRRTVTIDALGNRTTVAYDAVGNITALKDADNNTTTFAYDADNRMVGQTDQLGDTTTYAYNAVGLVTGTTDPDGRVVNSSYDADDRLTGQTWRNADASIQDVLTYTYDAVGNVLTAANSNGTYTLSYDADNRVIVAHEPFGQTLTFTYDAAGNRTVVQDSFGGLQTSSYDANNDLISQQFSGIGSTVLREDVTYNAVGQEQTLTRYSNLAGTTKVGSTTYSYDADSRMTGIQQYNGAGTVLANYTYTYDSAGRVTTEQLNGTTTTYTYDADNELLADGTSTYTYDATGNRTNTGYVTGGDNRLTNDGTWTYTYDAAGNLTEKSKGPDAETWTYGYNDANQMISADDAPEAGAEPNLVIDYKYDVFGNRIEEDVTVTGPDATTVSGFAYDGWKTQQGSIQATVGNENWDVWADLDGSNNLQTRYLRGDTVDQLFARVASDATAAWYLTDRMGSVQNLTDASGTVQDTITYDAWGNIAGESNATFGGHYKWTGQQVDSATGLQGNRARYYDAGTGRWISQDPLGFDAGDSNLYRYVNNEPTDATDPSGLVWGEGLSNEQKNKALSTVLGKGTILLVGTWQRNAFPKLFDVVNDSGGKAPGMAGTGDPDELWQSKNWTTLIANIAAAVPAGKTVQRIVIVGHSTAGLPPKATSKGPGVVLGSIKALPNPPKANGDPDVSPAKFINIGTGRFDLAGLTANPAAVAAIKTALGPNGILQIAACGHAGDGAKLTAWTADLQAIATLLQCTVAAATGDCKTEANGDVILENNTKWVICYPQPPGKK